MGPQLEAYVKSKGTIRLRRIDIQSWGSPVARQFDVGGIPALRLYDGRELLEDDRDEILEILNQ